jgi:hypothetical protein
VNSFDHLKAAATGAMQPTMPVHQSPFSIKPAIETARNFLNVWIPQREKPYRPHTGLEHIRVSGKAYIFDVRQDGITRLRCK